MEEVVDKDVNSFEKREEIYKEMFMALYELYFGRANFLDLLSKWEEILQIAPPAPLRRN